MKKLPLVITFLVFFTLTTSSYAADNFSVVRSVDGIESPENTFDAIEDLFDAVEQQSFGDIDGYTQQSAASATLSIRGVDASISYLASNSSLTFDVPSLGISKEFNNFSSRQENEDDFEAYLENNVDGILTKMLQQMVSTTASDPVAGNPNSLMSTMATADFDAAYDMASGSEKKQATNTNKEKNTKREIGLEIGRFSADGVEKNLLTLPLAYTHYFEDSRKKLRLSSPLSYIETNGSKAYKASFGATLSYPMNEQWSLIPSARMGILGSQDMGSAALVYSGSLTSMYQRSYKDMSLMFGNMLSIMTTADLKIEEHELPYDISNQIMKNGISVEKPISYKVLGKMASTEFSIANTQFFGDDLYIDNYTDLALSIGTRKRVTGASATDDSVHLGLTYTLGQHGYKGGKLNFGYRF